MYRFLADAIIEAPRDAVWKVWTDVDAFPEWDPREQRAALTGAFAVGSTIDSKQKGNPGGTATITEVSAPARWVASSPLPGGELRIEHDLEERGDATFVRKTYTVTGLLQVLFRLWWGPRVIAAMPATFDALERRAHDVSGTR
ncbi:SRPBCC domain-containing protein [Gordonia sp. NPDC003429]